MNFLILQLMYLLDYPEIVACLVYIHFFLLLCNFLSSLGLSIFIVSTGFQFFPDGLVCYHISLTKAPNLFQEFNFLCLCSVLFLLSYNSIFTLLISFYRFLFIVPLINFLFPLLVVVVCFITFQIKLLTCSNDSLFLIILVLPRYWFLC